MKRSFRFLFILLLSFGGTLRIINIYAQTSTHLQLVKTELQKKWPQNRTINLVFHGHSVPSGYFDTPNVHTLEAYPHQVLALLKGKYPYAVINCITTSIGGENSLSGEKRFKKSVLTHNPDVLFIDYALNDRMKVVLLCPSPDTAMNILELGNVLEKFEEQIIRLAAQYKIGFVDSYELFRVKAQNGEEIKTYMAQSSHPNAKGHHLIARQIVSKYF
jgi:hypothetical protein